MTGKPRLCIDIDNVLAQTDAVMRDVIRECTGGRVHLAYEHVRHFDYDMCLDAQGHSISKDEWRRIHEVFSAPQHIARIDLADGSRAALDRLADRYELHIVTSRLRKAWGATLDWLEDKGLPADALHFVGHRQKHVALGEFAAAVEDDYEQAALFAESGTRCYMVEHPWNMDGPRRDGLVWVKGWEEIEEALLA